jgi:hypothetical protein
MCRWTLGTIEYRCGVTVLSETVPRKFFLSPPLPPLPSGLFFFERGEAGEERRTVVIGPAVIKHTHRHGTRRMATQRVGQPRKGAQEWVKSGAGGQELNSLGPGPCRRAGPQASAVLGLPGRHTFVTL